MKKSSLIKRLKNRICRSHNFKFLGWEIHISPVDYMRLHTTIFPERVEDDNYELTWNMDKRIHAMAGKHEFIDYIFRDYDIALLMYRDSAAIILQGVMNSIRTIRRKLKYKGATDSQLDVFDNKVRECFDRTVNVVRQRAIDIDNPLMATDTELLSEISGYSIEEYHEGDKWHGEISESDRKDNNIN